ncbi:MAG: alpha-ketoacid dehydrogenase subunit alpha/beta [Chitinophagaceae bacterium]
MNELPSLEIDQKLSFEAFKTEVLKDYQMICESREASLLGRKEVLTGKAKFGIFGDGKEVPQIAMAKFFKKGDFYSGYYRDMTFAFATEAVTITQFFSQLYSDSDINNDPFSAGRQMSSHFATPFIDKNGDPLDLVNRKNLAAGMAPTASQMPRSVGLALASKMFRNLPSLKEFEDLSNNGNEVCFCTIGDASTSEGHFWETINAAGVLQIPLVIFICDDGYGISVPKKYQTTKGSISDALAGMQKEEDSNGVNIYKVKAWDYAGLCEVFEEGIRIAREQHIPAVFHVEEVTQPQGHSTSGSHERYKPSERLEWERQWCCLKKMREWLLENFLASEEELSEIELAAKKFVKNCREDAWQKYIQPLKQEVITAVEVLENIARQLPEHSNEIIQMTDQLKNSKEPFKRDIMRSLSRAIQLTPDFMHSEALSLYDHLKEQAKKTFNSHLYFEGPKSALNVRSVEPGFDDDAPTINGYEIINHYFDILFSSNPKVFAFGEDMGKIGDVNQGFAGLQEKYGEERIFDTGIRELTIIGQGIGMSMRGLRPIAEVQYLDYIFYGLQPLTDDVASMQYRTMGQQSAPMIVRTRGHRLEGIWHSGSPMGVLINALRGIYICVPRNMVQAAGMYNTLLDSCEPGIVVEPLNGYRLKEKLPNNLIDIRVPMGIPEVIREGEDITIVSYGSTLRIVSEAAEWLEKINISCEVLDVQTLLPFDIHHLIVQSLKKTNRILFVDEDVPSGAVAFMFNMVMEEQGGYKWLDVSPRTITSKAHRPGYGSDGDYFSKPNTEEIIETVRQMMAE